jgi:hypothetical protein
MQYLLDFVHDHALEEQLYCVLPSAAGELELTWRRSSDAEHWVARRTKTTEPARRVPRAALLAYLAERGADLSLFERELMVSVGAQVALAFQLLTDARRTLGSEMVDAMLRGHQQFARELTAAVASLTAPKLKLVQGDAVLAEPAPKGMRSGHLALVHHSADRLR